MQILHCFIKLKIWTILLTFTLPLFAQNIQTISGKVIDENNQMLIGNVLILSPIDSALIKGEGFLDTSFQISNIQHDEVLVKISALSYVDTIIPAKYQGVSEIDLGTIILRMQSNLLNTVTITARAPLVKYANNGTIEVNVANTMLSASSSIIEILSKSPNVIENNGQISVLGKGEAIIFLNGKLITYERLSSIPVSQILKVEIISNPSARYDAEGKAVINIITKPLVEVGILGKITQQLTFSNFAGANSQTFLDLSFLKGKVALNGNYSVLFGDDRMFLHTVRTRPAAEDYLKSDLTTDWAYKLNNYSNYNIGGQYTIDEKSNFSLSYSGFYQSEGGTTGSNNTLTTNIENSNFKSVIDKDELRTNNSLTLNYNRTIDTLGSALFIGSQNSNFNVGTDDFISEKGVVNYMDENRFLKTNLELGVSVYSTQVDYTKVYRNKTQLELGAKYSYVSTASETLFYVSNEGIVFEKNYNLSNNFNYSEKVPAAYFTLSGSKNNIYYTIGLRGEWTHYELKTSADGGRLLNDRYLNVFPNLQFNKKITAELKLGLSYVSRITRPRYQNLNPVVVYQDPFTTIEGNPDLVPEKVHSFEVNAIIKQNNFRLGYNYSKDPMDGAALRGSTPKSYVLKRINFDLGRGYFVGYSRTIDIKWWNSINTININYENKQESKYGFEIVGSRPNVYLYSSNTFNVKNLFKIQLLGWYLGRNQDGLNNDYQRYLVTLGIEKDVMKNKLKLRIVANDFFSRTNISGTYKVGETDIFFNRTFNNSYFRMIAAYNFGTIKSNNFKIKATGQTENSRAL